ncbi:MAG: hypothetical protein WC027_00150 [Candidatus Paceibacterota bacterium]
MTTFVVFIVALILLIALVTLKGLELSSGRVFILTNLFLKCDSWFLKVWSNLVSGFKKINWSNTCLIFQRIFVSIRRLIVSIKRRFDHKQSHFFIKRDHSSSKKGAVSFFLKDVAEYKKQLRDGGK